MEQSAQTSCSPAQRRRLKVRQMILRAADRVFARDGEAGLSIRRLADEIDYSPGAIYQYFGSKQELMDELKEMFFERLLEELPTFEGKTEAYPAFARESLETYMRLALEAPHHYQAAFSGQRNQIPSRLEPSDMRAKNRAFLRLYDMIEGGIERGVFTPVPDVSHIAKSIWAACHGLVVLMIHIPDFDAAFGNEAPKETNPEAIMARHADFLVRGVSL